VTTWIPQHPGDAGAVPETVGPHVFGGHLDTEGAFRLIDEGLEISVLDNFLELFPQARPELGLIIGISDRSLVRRRSQGRFTPAESDRLFRLVETYGLATRVLESTGAADEWMASPAVALGDRTPLTYLRNEAGTQRVVALLQRIEHGVYS